MKKLFFLAAVAGAALVSCTENDPAPQTLEQNAINFVAPVVSPNSRAQQEIGPNYSTSLPFNVWAYYYDQTTDNSTYSDFEAGQLFMNEVTAKYETDTWYPRDASDNHLFFWPKNGSLTFIAYQPISIKDQVTVSANGLTITDYVVDNTVSDNVEKDLLFSDRSYDQKKSTVVSTPYNGVQLNFKHALSAIVYGVQTGGNYTGTTIKLKSIKLNNVVKKGTFNQNLDDENGKLTNLPTVDDSNESSSAAAWTLSNTAEDKVTYTVTKDQTLTTDMYYTATSSATKPVQYTTDGFRNADHLLLPQSLTGVELEINYSLQHNGYEEIAQVYKMNLSGEWLIGYRYIYNIKISLDPITLAPTVAVWVDNTDINVAPDYQ